MGPSYFIEITLAATYTMKHNFAGKKIRLETSNKSLKCQAKETGLCL